MRRQTKYEISRTEKNVVTPEQLITLLKNPSCTYAAILQGESGSGKTRLVCVLLRNLKIRRKLSEQDLTINLVEAIRFSKQETYADFLFQYKIVAIEDVDFLKGKTATQTVFAHLINRLLKANIHVLITGIHLETRVPLLLSEIRGGKLVWTYM
jgi:chromosomal replication initiation ATPase DnaA